MVWYSHLFQNFPQFIVIHTVKGFGGNDAEGAETEQFYEDVQDLLEITPPKDVLFIIGDWNAKVGSQETSGVKASLALEYKMNQGKGQQSFAKRTHWS